MTNEPFVQHTLWRKDNQFRVVVHNTDNPSGSSPACAAVYGKPEPGDDCLVRIHSRCVYGEIFESDDCDCRVQLRESLRLIEEKGAGIVIYLDQEGRGEGLLAKARGYDYSQRYDKDTFDSYQALGLPADSRSYDAAAELLCGLGIERVSLLTNNPLKIKALEGRGIMVSQQLLSVAVSESARAYLDAKRRHGHRSPTS